MAVLPINLNNLNGQILTSAIFDIFFSPLHGEILSLALSEY
jgi:hypothetical protein